MDGLDFLKIIDHYNETEKKSAKKIPNSLKSFFYNNYFDITSYPRKINEFDEIINFIDEMHDNKKAILKYTINEEEFLLLQKILKHVENIQEKLNFKEKVLPFSSLLSAFGCYRIVKKLSLNKDSKIFEIGPGSGYTGALFNKEGFKYSSTDNSQGFYLWQSLIYKELDKNFDETLLNKDFKIFNNSNFSHLKWWEFAQVKDKIEKNDESADLIICNHALGELTKECLLYIIKISSKLLSNNDRKNRNSFFLSLSPGKQYFSNYLEILRQFENNGFNYIQFNEYILFFLKNSSLGKTLNINNLIPKKKGNKFFINLCLRINRIKSFNSLKKVSSISSLKDFSIYNTSNGHKTAKQLFKYIAEKKMLDKKYDFYKFIGTSNLNFNE